MTKRLAHAHCRKARAGHLISDVPWSSLTTHPLEVGKTMHEYLINDVGCPPDLEPIKEDNMNSTNNATQGTQAASCNDAGFMLKVANCALNVALQGCGPFVSARELADKFINDKKYKNDDDRIRELIRRECALSFGSGFATGLGGGASTIMGGAVVDMMSVLAINMRMVAAIAIIRGYDVEDDAVRSALMLTSIGTGIEEALGNAGIQIGKAGCKALICKIPKKLIGKINKFFGVKLLSKFSKKGIIQLGKAVPFAGGIVGGTVNVFGCRSIGKLACKAFPNEHEAAA